MISNIRKGCLNYFIYKLEIKRGEVYIALSYKVMIKLHETLNPDHILLPVNVPGSFS